MAIDFPDSPSNNDIYTVNGKRWIYSSGKWSIYGSTSPDATASDTEPTGVGDGHIWYRSDQSQTLIRYDNTWVEVGSAGGFDNASTNFPTSLDSATGFAAVEALQAKVGADSSAVTTSHDYKIADHASRLTTLEALGTAVAFTPSWTNFTPGNAVESWHYVRVNNLLYFGGVTILGTTSSVTGFMEMDFPVGTQVSTDGAPAGQASYGMTGFVAYGQLDQQTSDLRFFVSTANNVYVQQALTSATVPGTWASTNSIRAWGVVAIS